MYIWDNYGNCGIKRPFDSAIIIAHQIAPETRGQCTGLIAAKSYRGEKPEDKLIFQSDLFTTPYGGIYKIVFDDNEASFFGEVVEHDIFERGNRFKLSRSYAADNFEIIGTVHENPELLEGSNEKQRASNNYINK